MTRRGCFEGCVLLVLGAIAAAIAIPSCMTIKEHDHRTLLRNHLATNYKLCAFYLARDGKALFVRELLALDTKNNDLWKLFDLETGGHLDLNADCNKTKVLGKILDAHFGKLAYGLDLSNGDKSCITRTGEARDDWSCE